MARIRSIKPQFFTDDELAEIKPLGRLLFIGLWCIADRCGRLEDRPRRIKAEVMPFDNCSVDGLLSELHRTGFVQRYEIEGRRYIQISNFEKHQFPNTKEGASTIPAPDGHHASTVPAPDKNSPSRAPKGKEVGSGNTVIGSGNTEEGEGAPAVRPEIFALYEKAFNGPVPNGIMADRLMQDEAEFGASCLAHCLEEAGLAEAENYRYVEKILKRHKREGCDDTPKAQPRANGRGPKSATKGPRGHLNAFEPREGESEADQWERAARESYRNPAKLLPGDTGYQGGEHVQGVRPGKGA